MIADACLSRECQCGNREGKRDDHYQGGLVHFGRNRSKIRLSIDQSYGNLHCSSLWTMLVFEVR
jgi:hypothetical protein